MSFIKSDSLLSNIKNVSIKIDMRANDGSNIFKSIFSNVQQKQRSIRFESLFDLDSNFHNIQGNSLIDKLTSSNINKDNNLSQIFNNHSNINQSNINNSNINHSNINNSNINNSNINNSNINQSTLNNNNQFNNNTNHQQKYSQPHHYYNWIVCKNNGLSQQQDNDNNSQDNNQYSNPNHLQQHQQHNIQQNNNSKYKQSINNDQHQFLYKHQQNTHQINNQLKLSNKQNKQPQQPLSPLISQYNRSDISIMHSFQPHSISQLNSYHYSDYLLQNSQNSNQNINNNKKIKNQTKNIPKNYGKAIICYIEKYRHKVQIITQHFQIDYFALLQDLKKKKKSINTIADLRNLWSKYKYAKCMRVITSVFLRQHALSYIFDSRICTYSSHIKYRQRLCEAVQSPQEFKHIKDY